MAWLNVRAAGLAAALAAGALASGGAAAAQEAHCGLPPGAAPRVDDGVDIAAGAGSVEAALETPAADYAWLSFALTAPATVAIEAIAPATGGDPYAVLLGDDGATLAEDDDGAGSLSPRIEAALAPGVYCVGVRNVNGAPMALPVRIAAAGAAAPPAFGGAGAGATAMPPADPAAPSADATPDDPDALPAIAGLCGLPDGGVPLLGAGAEDVAAAGPVDGYVEALDGGWGYASFAIATDAEVRVEALATAAGGDPVLQLIDAAGAVIGEDDDGGGDFSSRIEAGWLPAGAYCVAVRNVNGVTDAFLVRAGLAAHTPITSGGGAAPGEAGPTCGPDTPALGGVEGPFDAALAGGPGVVEDVIPAAGGARRLSLAGPSAMTLTADNDDADPMLRLFDATGASIAENDDFRGVSARLDFASALPAGDYCLEVGGLNDASLPIRVTATAFDEARYLADLYRSGRAAPPLDGAWPVGDLGALAGPVARDYVLSAEEVRWLVFEIAERSLVLVEATGMTPDADPSLRLHDALGRPIEENDDQATRLDARVAPVLEPGRYLIGLGAGAGERAPAGVRLAVRRFVEAK
jgi:hypothetical protein